MKEVLFMNKKFNMWDTIANVMALILLPIAKFSRWYSMRCIRYGNWSNDDLIRTGYKLVEEYRRWLTYMPYNKNEIWAIRKCRSEVYRCIFAYSSLIIAGLINQGRYQEAKYISDHIKDYGKKPGFR